MATSDKKKQDDQAEFAASFNEPDMVKAEPTEDQTFGMGPEEGMPADMQEGMQGKMHPDGVEAVAPASATPVVDGAKEEQRLKSWEGRLKAKEAELAAKELQVSSSNVNEVQGEEAGVSPAEEDGEQSDPGKVLAEDFGEDFVVLLTKLITKIASDTVGSGVGGIETTVNQVIDELRQERQQNHFKRISDTHADFMEVIESPEFMEWLNAQSQEDVAHYQKTVETGSADDIVGMLTKFKASKEINGAGDDSAMDDAEGVRSKGMKLPMPAKGGDDYASAWNDA